jgi:hypothetical protein
MIEHCPIACPHSECDESDQMIEGCGNSIQDDCPNACGEWEEDYDELLGKDDYKDYGD